MRWLEGWFGTASGALGIVLMALAALLVPAQTESYSSMESCSSINGVESCYGTGAPPNVQPNYSVLILIGLGLLICIAVLVGTWLDLSGRRLVGRIILLTGATLLIMAFFIGGVALRGASGAVIFVYPVALMGIVAGILACVRREEPRAAPAVAPSETAS